MEGARNQKVRCISAVGIVLVLGSFALLGAAVSSLPQVSFEVDAEQFTYSIFDAADVPGAYEGSSYACLADLECSAGNDELCEIGSRLRTARAVFLSLVGVAFIPLCLLLERFTYLFLGLYAGGFGGLFALAGVSLFFSVAGALSFIGIGRAGLSCDKDSICGQASLVATLFQAGTCILITLCAFLIRRQQAMTPPNQNILISRKRTLQVITACVLGFALQVAGLGLNWLSYSTSALHRGSLWSMNSFSHQDDVEYSCVCLLGEDDDRLCEAMSRAWTAAKVYTVLWAVSTGLLAIWLDQMIYLGLKRPIGYVNVLYILPWVQFVIYLSAVLSWFLITGASKAAGCSMKWTDSEIHFCNEEGSIMAIVAVICFFMSGLFTNILVYQYWLRNHAVFPDEQFGSVQDKPKPRSHSKIDKAVVFEHTQVDNSFTGSTASQKQLEDCCQSCNKIYNSASLQVGVCGHILHRVCKQRIDGQRSCSECGKA